MQSEVYKDWYFNDNQELRNFIIWEIFKDSGAKRHTTEFILAGKDISLSHRFYPCGNFHYLIGQIKARFVENENEPSWHFFRSIFRTRFTDGNQPIELKDDWKNNIFGFDLIFDIDNKLFKKWFNKEGELNHPDILKKVNEGLPAVKQETAMIKQALDHYKVPYKLNFSGTGFRISIEWDDIKGCFTINDYGKLNVEFIRWVLGQVKENGEPYQFKCFGEIAIGYSLTRIVPTIHPLSKCVSWYLDDPEFEDFKLDDVNPYHLLESIKIDKPKGIVTINGKTYTLNRESISKKRKGDFRAIWEAFKKNVDVKVIQTQEAEKKAEAERIEETKRRINSLLQELPPDERRKMMEAKL